MKTLSRVLMIGRVGRDPELRGSSSGQPWTTLRLATDRRTRRGSEWESVTDWHDVRVFGKQAENAHTYLRRGSVVLVEGSLQYETWTDDNDRPRISPRVVANRVQFIDKWGRQPETGGLQPQSLIPGSNLAEQSAAIEAA